MSQATAELREVRGPSALGGGWRRSLELLYLMAVTEFKKTYFGTVLGYLWSLARPLMLFGVLLAVFTQVFRIGSLVPNYEVLLLFNIVLFGFFQEATLTAVSSIASQEAVVRKTQFPRLVIPLAVVLTAAFNLGLNLIVVFVFILAFGVSTPLDVAAVPRVPGPVVRSHHGRLDDRLVAVPALPRHRDHLDRALDCALLRHADPLPDRGRPAAAAGLPSRQPADSAVRAGAGLGDRPERPRARRGGGRGRGRWWPL